jgi:hypothetical protein
MKIVVRSIIANCKQLLLLVLAISISYYYYDSTSTSAYYGRTMI